MAFFAGVGSSTRPDNSFDAGQNAAAQAIRGMAGHAPAGCIVLASGIYDQEAMIKGVTSVAGDIPLVGCTTSGEITTDGPQTKSVAVLLMAGDEVSFSSYAIENISRDMRESGRAFGRRAQGGEKGKGELLFIFSDALSGNGTELVRGVFEILGAGYPLVGGAAADDMNFKKTSQYCDDRVLNDAAVGLLIRGNIKSVVAAGHGWHPIGIGKKVTRAKGTTVYELDGKPAFSIYEEYFGDQAEAFKKILSVDAVSYPLGMKNRETSEYMIRVPLKINEDGSIVCGAEVIEGSEMFLMMGTPDKALDAARETVALLLQQVADIKTKVVFVSDCIARKILFAGRNSEEITSVRDLVGSGSAIFGFYSYGQIAPLKELPSDVNVCDPGFYEQSISLAVFGQ